MAQDIQEKDFAQEVVQSDKPVLIDFYAPWCGPCKLVAPILEEISRERADLKIVKVDVDQAPALAQQHRIMSVPTLALYNRGQMVASWVGLRPKPMLLSEIDKALAKA
ncbi:MAG: thioredoxin [Candidatus Firestonebacteria bacterium]|nr:thioredoxin [Candidatus Firestonebacteria bacterium]